MSKDDKDERFYRDTEAIASPKLDDWQLALLEPLGHRRMLRRGELVFKAGQRDLGLAVVLSGEVEAFEARDGIEQILGTSGPRGFVGDVAMLNGTSAAVSYTHLDVYKRQSPMVPGPIQRGSYCWLHGRTR